MKRIRTQVYCLSCAWRGKRRSGECACYDDDALYCRCTWGSCPRCGSRVSTRSPVKLRQEQEEVDAMIEQLRLQGRWPWS